ncbi:telomere-binding protein CDC13 [Saccharomyces eubayanus]|uniref:telomere-binding protein CDC13 n=1 Tax=Saccharomyces eubayanus TaxID=1080349 RepID=UPI0006C69E8E|nr:CDC13-like protein [Saccharomyces eubayanus]KOH00161.1 CDC13-like protein [Saccharomyces eubayanus]
MDTFEEPECPPHKPRAFVKSTKEFEDYPNNAIVPVQFVSLLTSIRLTETKCLLGFSNFESGKDQAKQCYTVKLKFKDKNTERLARMTISLVCRYFDIELPDLDLDTESCSTFILEDIHFERLCFASCKTLYVSQHGNYTLFLEDIKPLDLAYVINTLSKGPKNCSNGVSLSAPNVGPNLKESLATIFDNLITMNRDQKNSFKFVKLIHYDTEVKEFIQERQRLLLRKSKPNPVDPFFVPHRLGAASLESQNEFNSQLMTLNVDEEVTNTSSTRDDLDAHSDPIEDSDVSSSSSTGTFLSSRSYIQSQTPERKTKVPNDWPHHGSERKKRKLSFTDRTAPSSQLGIDYERLSMASLGSMERFEGKFVGMYPPEFHSVDEFKHCTLKLYFTPLPLSAGLDRVLVPGVNCLEIILPTVERIRDLFGSLNCQSDKISAILLMDKPGLVTAEIERILWDNDETVSPGLAVWSLKNIRTDAHAHPPAPLASLPSNPPRLKMRELAKKDPTIEFRELALSAFDTKFVTMFGMVVSCSFDKPAFVSFVFTDFTKNDITQNYLYDRYLVDYEAKLELDEGFKAIMYKNQFEVFDSRIEKIFGRRLKDLQNGNDENVSQHGIVCRMNMKVKIYNGKLNAIVRECVPIPYAQANTLATPTQFEHLRSFYQRAFGRLGESAISRYFDQYTTFFPIQRNKHHLAELQPAAAKHSPEPAPLQTAPPLREEYIPDLNADVESFDVEFTDIFPLLHSLTRGRSLQPQPHKNHTLYSCEGRVVAIECHPTDLCFHITDELTPSQTRGPDPQRVLQLHITTPKNLAYFFNRTSAFLQSQDLDGRHTQLAQFLGHRFKFNITSSRLLLPAAAAAAATALQIWCPIECTFQELQQQHAYTAAAAAGSGSPGGINADPPRLLAALDGVTVKREDADDAVTAGLSAS